MVAGVKAGVSAGEGLDELHLLFRRLAEGFSQAIKAVKGSQ